jgi:hypothetical protein
MFTKLMFPGMKLRKHITHSLGKSSPQFDPVALGSFTALNGYKDVDITTLVQAWVAGTTPNNGVLLNQTVVEPGLITFWSKDHAGGIVAPYIQVTYTPAGGGAPKLLQKKLLLIPGFGMVCLMQIMEVILLFIYWEIKY